MVHLGRSFPFQVASSGRHGLDQRKWAFDSTAAYTAFYQDAGLLEEPILPSDPPPSTLLWEWDSTPRISERMIQQAYPVAHNAQLFAAPPRIATEMRIPGNWELDPKWLQVSSGYFVPPVTGQYMFSVFCRSDAFGSAYMMLSGSADPAGAYKVAKATGFHSQTFSRWITLTAGQMYYTEFWQDFLHDGTWGGGGRTDVAVRLATTDAVGQAIDIPPAVTALGLLETGAAGCAEQKVRPRFDGTAPALDSFRW